MQADQTDSTGDPVDAATNTNENIWNGGSENAGAEGTSGPIDMVLADPVQPLRDGQGHCNLTMSLLVGAEHMAESLSGIHGVSPWMQEQLWHLKNLLVAAQDRLTAGLDDLEGTELAIEARQRACRGKI